MWWPLIKSLGAFLDGALNPTGTPPEAKTNIIYDPAAVVGSFPSVGILRQCEKRAFHPRKEGTIDLFVECWVRNDNSSIVPGFDQLYALEAKVQDAVRQWQRTTPGDPALGIGVKATLTSITPRSDVSRPTYCSRSVIELKWERSTY